MTDLDTRLVVYDGNTPLDILTVPLQVQWAAPMNDTPTLTITYSDFESIDRADWLDQLISNQYDVAIEVNWGSGWQEPRGGRFIMMDQSDDTAEQQHIYQLVGIGVDDDLNGVQITDKTLFNSEGKLVFTNATPGQILDTFHSFGASHGMLDILTNDFSETRTSAQDEVEAWNSTITWAMPFGTSYRAALDMLASYGMINWCCEGNKLRVFNDSADGHVSDWGGMQRDLTDGNTPVELVMGREVNNGPQQISRRNLASDALIMSDNNASWLRSNTSIDIKRGKRVVTFDQGGLTTVGAAAVIGDRILRGAESNREQLTREISFQPPRADGTGGAVFLPWRDYKPGDWVYAPGKQYGALERLRVSQITLTQDDQGTTSGSLIMADRLYERSVAIQKQLAAIQGGAVVGTGGGSTAPKPPGRKPAKPAGTPSVTGAAYVDNTGHVRATINIQWAGVVLGTDGAPIDIDHYEVRMRRKKRAVIG